MNQSCLTMRRDNKNYFKGDGVTSKYSEKMQMNYDVDYNTGIVTFEDGVKYNREEMRHLNDVAPETMTMLHKLKKIFGGTIVQ